MMFSEMSQTQRDYHRPHLFIAAEPRFKVTYGCRWVCFCTHAWKS